MQNDPSHLGPDLGPVGQAILEAEGGKTGLLALLTSFPTSKDSCKKIGNLYLPFFTVDDCIEQRSILREAEETARWCKALWHMR